MMWTVKPAPMPVQFLRGRTGTISVTVYSQPPPGIHRRLYNIPPKSQRTESSESVGGLGQQILLHAAESNQNKPVPKEKEISGSDVLWAIQRATAQRKRSNADRKKKKKKMKEVTGVELSSSAGESTRDNGVDYSNVRPLRIRSDWGRRLDEFEKLLKEFQDAEL